MVKRMNTEAHAASSAGVKKAATKKSLLAKKAAAVKQSIAHRKFPATKKAAAPAPKPKKVTPVVAPPPVVAHNGPYSIQIAAGSYDRVLHGIIARISPSDDDATPATTSFADSFLFNAHNSAIRCLALSPPSLPQPGKGQKVFLASGSTDERVNVYSLSVHEPKTEPTNASADDRLLAALAPRPIRENKKNREVGTLLHHSSSITCMMFPSRFKLYTASEDATIAVTRTRDWQLLQQMKVKRPRAESRPSGDTAVFGNEPAGANDFTFSPSGTVMLSVSKGEKMLRLWNNVRGELVKSKLAFVPDLLMQLKESRFSTGEGLGVKWAMPVLSPKKDGEKQLLSIRKRLNKWIPHYEADPEDETAALVPMRDQYIVSFQNDLVVFNYKALVQCTVLGDIRTKVHQIAVVRIDDDHEENDNFDELLAVSTEDGRILFYTTRTEYLIPPNANHARVKRTPDDPVPEQKEVWATARMVAQIGGRAAGINGRIKDFKVLRTPSNDFAVVGASSDGLVRVWTVKKEELRLPEVPEKREAILVRSGGGVMGRAPPPGEEGEDDYVPEEGPRVGTLVGTYETQNRIMCLEAFVLTPRPEDMEESEAEKSDSDSSDDDE